MFPMKLNALILLAAGAALAGNLFTASADTTFARDALKPYVDNGQLPGAISVFSKPGAEEVACVGYADVAAKRAIQSGQKVLYVTERCVFRLTPKGLKLIEAYPGVDVQKDILDRLPFEVEI